MCVRGKDTHGTQCGEGGGERVQKGNHHTGNTKHTQSNNKSHDHPPPHTNTQTLQDEHDYNSHMSEVLRRVLMEGVWLKKEKKRSVVVI